MMSPPLRSQPGAFGPLLHFIVSPSPSHWTTSNHLHQSSHSSHPSSHDTLYYGPSSSPSTKHVYLQPHIQSPPQQTQYTYSAVKVHALSNRSKSSSVLSPIGSERKPEYDRLTTDSFMEAHCVPGEDLENRFDFILLPGVVNARRGMKIAAPETIPCKYGHSCFRRDCRFAHVDDTSSLVVPLVDTYSRSRSQSPSDYSSSSSEPSTPPGMPIRDFAVAL